MGRNKGFNQNLIEVETVENKLVNLLFQEFDFSCSVLDFLVSKAEPQYLDIVTGYE